MSDQRIEPSNRANIYDVARLAGVSHMTVSRVLNGRPNIRESTRERVNRAIEELNYQRSASARALAMRKTKRLGVLVDNPVEYGPSSMLRAFEAAAHAAGYSVGSFTTTDEENRGAEVALESLLSQDVDGLCAIAPRASSLHILRQRNTHVPTILLAPEEVPGIPTAAVDQYAGAQLAVQHLLERGHTRIAHLGGPLDWFDARQRERGWRDALGAAGLEAQVYFEGDWTSECGYNWALSFDPGRCTAVFVANDQMALGVIHGLAQRGIRVPGDVSVVGFDDVPDAAHFLPPLTTVRQDFEELGRAALSLLVDLLEDGQTLASATPGRVRMQPTLVVRESTAQA